MGPFGFLQQLRDAVTTTHEDGPPPIIQATQPRYKPNRIATIETVRTLTAIMPEHEWKEIERRVLPEA